MKYVAKFDVWKVSEEFLSTVQPGQWVYAGGKTNVGRFWGVRKSGSMVVAWQDNAKRSGNYRQYQEILRNYGRGVT